MILQCSHIQKAFSTDVVLNDVSFHINDNEKAAIVGINGSGKSTLLKIIMKQMRADDGEVILRKDASVGYLAQNQEYESGKTIYEEMQDARKEVPELEQRMNTLSAQMDEARGEELESLIRQYDTTRHRFEQLNGYAYQSELTGVLKGLGFSEEDFQKPVSTLSGGEKTRVALGKMLLQAPDLIIMDEPTNHLDIDSKEILENAIRHFEGTVLYVSHDRYFINTTATRVLNLTQKQVLNYVGNYDYYLEKKEDMERAHLTSTASDATSQSLTPAVQSDISTENSAGKLTWQQQKEEQARRRKIENELRKTEEEIEQLENRNEELETALADPANGTNVALLQELSNEKEANDNRLLELMELWETLSVT